MFGQKWEDEYKILFVGLRTDELGLDTGKEVEGLGLIERAGSVEFFRDYRT